eukprot:Hpha_TRINITY_DN22145_c0_g1::TRINITY_DN22145_c0_g1_i1::g.103690::m.103690
MGCGASAACGQGRQAQQIFVSRYKPRSAEEGGEVEVDSPKVQPMSPEQAAAPLPTCAACGGQLPGTPFCAMTGLRHTLFASAHETEDAEARAERVYLMGIYDSPTLLQELLSYIGHGTTLEKWGTDGMPHVRQFWLETRSASEGAKLYWKDKRQRKGSAILSSVRSIVLGKRPDTANRKGHQAVRAHSPELQDVYLRSFSIVFRESSGMGSIELTAGSVQEFEAWIISLSHVVGVPPQWGELMDISDSPLLTSLTTWERDVCATHCIPPALYLQVAQLLRRKRDKVRAAVGWEPREDLPLTADRDVTVQDHPDLQALKVGIVPARLDARGGALHVTKGELRYWTRCDIFRTCVMWCMLERKGIIYDPGFRWASPPMSFSLPWRWSPTGMAYAPMILRRSIRSFFLVQRGRPRSGTSSTAIVAGSGCRAAAKLQSWNDTHWLPLELINIICEFIPRFS